ncbi:hypothetical protein CHUAL_005588 [Chamberlinius hualienensis]
MEIVGLFQFYVEIAFTAFLCSMEQLHFHFEAFLERFTGFSTNLLDVLKEKLLTFIRLNFSVWINLQLNRNWYEDSRAIFIKLSNCRFQLLLWMYTTVPIFGPVTEYYRLLKWVRSLIGSFHNITNFREDWTDGIALCALLERLVPGSCPRHDTLQPKHKLVNIDMGLRLAETHLGVVPHVKPDEIMAMAETAEKNLQLFFTNLRSEAEKRRATRKTSITKSLHYCFPRGLGLIMATTDQNASFNIYIETSLLSSVQVEIQGPTGERFSETITHRSPRKKQRISPSNTRHVSPINETIKYKDDQTLDISFEYEIQPDKILVNYVPHAPGRYIISVIYRGHNVFLSPFHVTVYDDPDAEEKENLTVLSGVTTSDSKTPIKSLNPIVFNGPRYEQFLSPDSAIV